MKISAKVKAGAREDKVDRIDQGNLRISVKAQAKEGKANQAVIRLLSCYFDIPKSRITILKGHTSKNKILEIIPG
ncbi:MAG: DUF167 domain-containing protein [Candidatus Omnitrophica bacterium]|nr:DUF167 domain-containing protein [Candidatus Omnitrophota bacterium]